MEGSPHKQASASSISLLSSSSSPPMSSSSEELQRLEAVPTLWSARKKLTKQLSLRETCREKAWERRKRQISLKAKRNRQDEEELTDEDLNELKGCIELGFGFNEEKGHQLCNTLPALDLYFAVNRQFSSANCTPATTPNSSITRRSLPTSPEPGGHGGASSSVTSDNPSPKGDSDSWKICSPGLLYIFKPISDLELGFTAAIIIGISVWTKMAEQSSSHAFEIEGRGLPVDMLTLSSICLVSVNITFPSSRCKATCSLIGFL